MSLEQEIRTILDAKLAEENLFLVDLEFSPDSLINILADSMEGGIAVSQCVAINRLLRNELGEKLDNYEMTVSSPGLGRGFKHINQYIKNVQKPVEIILHNGQKLQGILGNVEPNKHIEIYQYIKKNTKAKSHKPQASEEVTVVNWEEAKETKVLLNI